METVLFDFALPSSLIALRPSVPRDHARLLVVRSFEEQTSLDDRFVFDLPDILRPGDVLVLNDTKVLAARLFGTRQRGERNLSVELLLHTWESDRVCSAFARPLRRLKIQDRILFECNFKGSLIRFFAHVEAKTQQNSVKLRFEDTPVPLKDLLSVCGQLPLPPYIIGKRPFEAADFETYQTVYADKEGAIAAPTAGLHFTENLLKTLHSRGIQIEKITLHVGAGTFLPVQSLTLEEHVMHREWGEISADVARRLTQARQEKRRVIAIGTTSVRLLESATNQDGETSPFCGETDLFIKPGYSFRSVSGMMTNFHLPRSTLFMLVCSACGISTMQAAYAHAILHQYRFYSYGDSSLLLFGSP